MAELAETLRQHGVEIGTLTRTRISAEWPEVYKLVVPGDDALAVWAALRNMINETGYWPLLIGEEQSAHELMPMLFDNAADEDASPEDEQNETFADALRELLAKGLQLDPIAWVEDRYAQAPEYRRSLWDEEPEEGQRFEDYDQSEKQTLFAYWGKPPLVHLALLPVTQGWQVPALLNYGWTNECPIPEEHVCMMRSWHERFGAELVW